MPRMKAAVFVEPGRIVLESRPVPDVGPLDALMRGDGFCREADRIANGDTGDEACDHYHRVDYPMQRQIPKPSARWYAATIKSAVEGVAS